jgi:nitric oxide reductase activation protein
MANGTTPEGLCYEAIMKNFVPTTNDLDSYFLNICDGEPNFTEDGVNYSGYLALNHTKTMVKMIKSMGVNMMSYFVSSYHSESSTSNFKTMYGDSARFIDISNIIAITNTLNQMFLKK